MFAARQYPSNDQLMSLPHAGAELAANALKILTNDDPYK